MEVYVDDESKLTLHGLVQHYTMLSEDGKNKRLMDLLDQLDFNQVCGTPNNCVVEDNCGAFGAHGSIRWISRGKIQVDLRLWSVQMEVVVATPVTFKQYDCYSLLDTIFYLYVEANSVY